MSTFRVAIIGCSRIGRTHARAYQSEPRAEMVAICDIDQAKAEALKKDYAPQAKIYADYRELLKTEKPDHVVIGLWTHLHLPVVRECMEQGIRSVHCEKPVAGTWGDVQEMARIAEAAEGKTRLTFNHQRRFGWSQRKLRDMLFSGEFGGLQRIEVFNPDNLLDWGTHMVDLMHMYNHQCPAKWVMGQLDARHPKQWFDIPFEFAFCGTMKFENGVRAVIHSGDDKEMPCGMRLICSNGILEFRNEDVLRTMKFGEGKWLEEQAPVETQGWVFSQATRHLLETLESGQRSELCWRHAVQNAQVIYAFYESVRRRARVELPLQGMCDHPLVTMLKDGAIVQAAPAPKAETKPMPVVAMKPMARKKPAAARK